MFKKKKSIPAKQIVDFERFHFSERQCQQLYEMICVDDEINLQNTFPDIIGFNYTQKQLIESFIISRQLWLEGITDKRFPQIIKQLCTSCHITEEDKVIYKMVRAKFKHLCYAFQGFDTRHKRPLLLGRSTALLGIIQDGFKNTKTNIVIPNALLLNMLWNETGLKLLKKEVYRFFPCDVENFSQAVHKRVAFIKKEIETNKNFTAHQFHFLRKQVSMLSAIYGTLDVLFPSNYHHKTFQYIATINGLMGNYHDLLIEQKLNKTQNYFFDRFVLPEEISERLAVLVKYYIK